MAPDPPLDFKLPGTIPTLQGLVEQLFGFLSPASASKNGNRPARIQPDRPVEDGDQSVLFAATALTLQPRNPCCTASKSILGDDPAAFLALGTLFLGPLISGTGAFGEALQNLIDSESLEDFFSNSLDLVGLPINGVVNGGFGPNLKPLLPFLPACPCPRAGDVASSLQDLSRMPLQLYRAPWHLASGIRPQARLRRLQRSSGHHRHAAGIGEQFWTLLPTNQMISPLKAPAGEQNDPEITNIKQPHSSRTRRHGP